MRMPTVTPIYIYEGDYYKIITDLTTQKKTRIVPTIQLSGNSIKDPSFIARIHCNSITLKESNNKPSPHKNVLKCSTDTHQKGIRESDKNQQQKLNQGQPDQNKIHCKSIISPTSNQDLKAQQKLTPSFTKYGYYALQGQPAATGF